MRLVTLAGMLTLLVAGCQGASALRPMAAGLSGALPVSTGSMLLARARASVHAGAIDPAMLQALAASTVPRDRQAARLLTALDAPTPTAEDTPEAPEDLSDAPRIKMGTAPPEAVATARPVRPAAPPPATVKASGTNPAPTSTVAPTRARAKLVGLGLKRGRHGVSLSLKGSGGLVVGVASQPASGIVRLVMDAEASTSALRARPTITGARVTAIRRTGKSVFVTLTLDPGWSLRGIVKTRGGARVDLRSPA
ncbi:MAG: hypothetical protein KUG77_17480 [Nannocystaceae bacterium]|nr:hypothetical protein [Nannocystaceae bacterium]